MKKLPQITAMFWVLKIACTTLGETGGDHVAQTLHVGYLASFFLFIALFLVTVTVQLRAERFHPALYWTVIISTSTAGTTLSDFMDRTVGLGYFKGSLILVTCLGMTFLVWSRTTRRSRSRRSRLSGVRPSTGRRSCSPTRWARRLATGCPTAQVRTSGAARCSSPA